MACILNEAVKELISESVDLNAQLSDTTSIEWDYDYPSVDDDTYIAYYDWTNSDGYDNYCSVTYFYDLKATGSNYSSFRITIEKLTVGEDEDDRDKQETSYIQISINQISDFIYQHGHITELSGDDDHNCPCALEFMKSAETMAPLWKQNPTLSWDEITSLSSLC